MVKNNSYWNSTTTTNDFLGVSDEALLIYTWVVYSVVCQLINVFGIATNIINITCFIKQGFKDSANMTLLGLSVSDLGSLVTMVWISISLTPAVISAEPPFDSMDVCYLTGAMPHFTFTRISSFITAMITMERCFCIIAPLKIKNTITSRRAAVVIVLIFGAIFCSMVPLYTVNKLDMKFSPGRNKTILGIIFSKEREKVEKISFVVNNFTIPFLAFFIVVISTATISFKLRETTQWRQKTVSVLQSDRVTGRNQKVAKMVVLISTLFISCFVPSSIMLLTVAFIPSLSIQGKHLNIGIVIIGICYTMESINSSMNIFIYYHMSSKYRDVFRKIFFVRTNKKNE